MIIQTENNMTAISIIIAIIVMVTGLIAAFDTSTLDLSPFNPQTAENDISLIRKPHKSWNACFFTSHPYTLNASPLPVLLSMVVIGVPFGMVSRTAPPSDVLQDKRDLNESVRFALLRGHN